MSSRTPILLLVSALALPAAAEELSIDLVQLGNRAELETVSIDGTQVLRPTENAQQQFRLLAGELGLALLPKGASPAGTLGLLGFDFSTEFGLTHVHDTRNYWVDGTQGSRSPTLFVTQLHARKGLPFSFELGGTLGYLMNTRLFVLGGELKWAVQEGYFPIPDIAVRGGLSRVLGRSQLDLTMADVGLLMSLPLPLEGFSTLTPQLGYSLVMFNMASEVLDSTPDQLEASEQSESLFQFPRSGFSDNRAHRISIGLRFTSYVVSTTYQLDVSILSGIGPSSVPVLSHTLKLGLDF